MGQIRIKRIYEPPTSEDGTRFLVDRLWPRGVSKDKADISAWLKALAPSNALRMRFHGKTEGSPETWDAFCLDYNAELDAGGPEIAEALAVLNHAIDAGTVTLLYAARNEEQNNAVALSRWLAAQ